jgi:hypothetical protein
MIFTAKEQIVDQMRKNLETSSNTRARALLRIFENQTRDEQASESTNHYNGIGFTGSDAQFLTSLAKQFKYKGYLSPKQDAILARKIKKYARQLVEGSIAERKIKTYGKYYYTNDNDLKTIKEM